MKTFFSLVLIIISVFLYAPDIHAAVDRQPKTITGKVLYPDGTFAKNADVYVTCDGITLHDTVSNFGNYSVTYGDMECEQFDTVSVSAQIDTMSASLTTEVVYFKTNTMGSLILSSISVPEFGMITAIMSGSLSVLGYGILKKTLW